MSLPKLAAMMLTRSDVSEPPEFLSEVAAECAGGDRKLRPRYTSRQEQHAMRRRELEEALRSYPPA